MPLGNFDILVDGNTITAEAKATLRSLEIVEELNYPTSCTFQLNIQRITDKPGEGYDLALYVPGATLVVKLGMDAPAQIMTTGWITAVEAHFSDDSTVTITGYDGLQRLRFGTHTRTFTKKSVSDLARTMASEASLTIGTIDNTTTVFPSMLQIQESDYDFLLRQAAQLGYEMLMDAGKFSFRAIQAGRANLKTLTFLIDFTELRLRLRALPEGGSVEARGWDMNAKQAVFSSNSSSTTITVMGGSSDGGIRSSAFPASAMSVSGMTITDRDQAQNVATGIRKELLIETVEGDGVMVGAPWMHAGINVSLQGLGSRFSGKYYVTATRHLYRPDDGYLTYFSVARTGV
jgi:uncharacterized protein